ncbi:MAG TPA: ABC transporter permease, partial [Candidatus Limnocylindrales bacterium]|nr:ABC transporter permease [Candidatus Limnocylindrales bacterium]
ILSPGVVPSDDAARMSAIGSVLARGLSSGAPLPTIEHDAVFGSADADILDAFAPALIGYFAYFLVFILTGISFLRERVGGTLERLLATPVMRSEIVAGYAAGFGLFATLQVIVIMLSSLGTLSVPALGPLPAFSIGLGIANAGSPVLAFAVVLLLALGAVSLGIFISTFARTELQILQFIPIVIVPQGLLGGIFWPVESLPDALEVVARALPLTYAVDGLREVLVKGADLASPALQLDLGVLAGIAVLLVVLATLTIRREVA